jgi:DNA-binding response OmpR family regulator
LRKHGILLKLSGQAIQVLAILTANPGKLVTREELQKKLWPAESFGDFEHGLNAAVNKLREKLGDSAVTPT